MGRHLIEMIDSSGEEDSLSKYIGLCIQNCAHGWIGHIGDLYDCHE